LKILERELSQWTNGIKRGSEGNEAIALGALRAGVRWSPVPPARPPPRSLEAAAKYRGEGVYVEWSTNEKAALEVAAGAAYAGARSMVTKKQVGLNVASDR
jgi:indolepyruvate ferredoxin oxidoreductase alpha subunit